MYGYEMTKEMESDSGGIFTLKEGTLYPILHALEADKLVESYWSDHEKRKRKYYRITTEGRAQLEEKKQEWMMGLLIAVVVAIFITRLVRIASKLRDTYGKMLVIGITTILATFSVWSILMSVGILPIMSISLPFISNGGGLHIIMEFAAVGVVLSVYRRKNMMSSSNSIRLVTKKNN